MPRESTLRSFSFSYPEEVGMVVSVSVHLAHHSTLDNTALETGLDAQSFSVHRYVPPALYFPFTHT